MSNTCYVLMLSRVVTTDNLDGDGRVELEPEKGGAGCLAQLSPRRRSNQYINHRPPYGSINVAASRNIASISCRSSPSTPNEQASKQNKQSVYLSGSRSPSPPSTSLSLSHLRRPERPRADRPD